VSDTSHGVNQPHDGRRRVTWPVTVQTDAQLLHGETLDVGPQGAKLRLPEHPEVGARITLHLTPTGSSSLAIEAIVWRLDRDGVVVFFLSTGSGADERAVDPSSTPMLTAAPETILVVDDEPEVLSMVGDSLEAGGYHVLKTVDPFEALRLARTSPEPIHLLLTDVVMPLMHGVKLADEFRAIRPDARVLFMSAFITKQVEEHGAMLVPGVSLLVKPFGLASLHDRVRSVLDYRSPFARMLLF
jgi:CheY-like chemotaxis protein